MNTGYFSHPAEGLSQTIHHVRDSSSWRILLGAPGLLLALTLAMAPVASGANIAPEGFGIFGFNDAVDGDAGEEYAHSGLPSNINDGSFTTRLDNWKGDAGGDGGQDFSYVGIVWPEPRTDAVTVLRLTLATFLDGGWFGVARQSPPAGGFLTAEQLVDPVVQVTVDGGSTWTTVPAVSNYLSSLTGHRIGGGGNVNPSSKAATFTLSSPQTNINGVRIIGENGGVADGGFLAVFELEVEAISSDSDNDGIDDQWEVENGLLVGTNDAALDADVDGLSNLLEFQNLTDPQNPDTDGDGLQDGPEVLTHQTDPKAPDTDGDGLSDGAEVSINTTNPKLADTDGDGLNDGQEVFATGTNPLVADTDGDGYSDGLEVRLASNPLQAEQVPANIASSGMAIIGTSTAQDGGTDTPYSQQNTPGVINDADLNSRVDTFGRTDPFSYVGIVWETPRTVPVDRLEVSLATFVDGGWFGPNGAGPGEGGQLDPELHLSSPEVQVTLDGTTWTTVPSSTNYLSVLGGHFLPVAGAGPTRAQAAFQLTAPQADIRGIRLIGSEGGIASEGFIGVWELAVKDAASLNPDNIALDATAIAGTSTDLSEGMETRYTQQGTPGVINDGNFDTRTDTFGRTDPFAFAGVIWPTLRSVPVDRVEATFVIFGDGGWFGPNDTMPSAGILSAAETLVEPELQVTSDGGLTWTTEPHTSTYLPALEGVVPGGVVTTPTVVFALTNPRAGIDGIRLMGPEGGSASGGFLGMIEFAVREVEETAEANLALSATGFIGTNDAVDADSGTKYGQAGIQRNVNDGVATSRVDTFDGAAGVDPVSYAGLLWPEGRPVSLGSVSLTMATFTDGGWFGPGGSDPGPGGNLEAAFLVEPVVQVLNSAGEWTAVSAVSDYLTSLAGHGIGGGANPNPTAKTAVFTFNPPLSNVTGVRLAGESGGTASSGFLGVFELAAAGAAAPPPADTDGDGQADAAEILAGTDPSDPNSVLRMGPVAVEAGMLSLTWNSVPGKSYQLQTSTTPAGGWVAVGAVIPAAIAPAATTATTLALPAGSRGFYRIVVVP